MSHCTSFHDSPLSTESDMCIGLSGVGVRLTKICAFSIVSYQYLNLIWKTDESATNEIVR